MRAFLSFALMLVACGREPLPPHRHAPVERINLAWEHGRDLRVWKLAQLDDSTLLPLLIFSPGLGQEPVAYDSLLTSVAARGFMVLGVPLGGAQHGSTFNVYGNLSRLTHDASRALDRVLADSLAAIVDTARIGAFGHAYGGAMSAELCHRDPRIKAALNLDGSVFGLSVTRGSACPFLLLLSELPWIDRTFGRPQFHPDRDQGRLHEEMMFTRSRRMWWITVDGLDHMAFTDAAFSTTRWRRLTQTIGLELDAPRVHEAAGRYVNAFFTYTLRDGLQPEELQRSPYPFAAVRSRP